MAYAKEPGYPYMTMRCGYTLSRQYQLRGTNRVYHDLRGTTISAMSPRTSYTAIRPVLDPWAIPRGTLASPRLTHLHHHSSSRQQLPPVPPLTSRTRCSPLLSALMHSGTRPKSTESSSHRIWRHFALICVRCWPTRPLFFSSSSRFRPSLHSFLPDHQGSSLHILLLFHCQWGHCPFLFGGGGGGGGCGWCSGFS